MSIRIFPTEFFANIRQNGGYYVDKTRFLEQFLNECPDAALFIRPRRFGKTLFMNMLTEFFDIQKQGDGQNLFEGLDVSANEKLCQEWMHQYPVIFLTLKDVDRLGATQVPSMFQFLIQEVCSQHRYLLTSKRVSSEDKHDIRECLDREADGNVLERALRTLMKALYSHYGKETILLIDEYDVPVARAAEGQYYDEMILFMRNFLFSALKANPYLKFAILTGCLRIAQESIFSGLDNLKCYDVSSADYADIFGFTQDEVDKMLIAAGHEEKRDIIREWYDGYNFGNHTNIYCPWTITQYFYDLAYDSEEDPQPYWVRTSSNELTQDFGGRLPADADIQGQLAALHAGHPIAVKLNQATDYIDIFKSAVNFWTLLYLTGYLTLAREPELAQAGKDAEGSLLVIPNKEVRKVFRTELERWLKHIMPDIRRKALYTAFWEQDIQRVEELVTELLVDSRCYEAKEAYYHGILFAIFAMRYGDYISRGESGRGLYDIVIKDIVNSCAAVLEFRLASSTDQLEACVHDALNQIAEQDYDARLRAEGWKTILHAGIAFCKKPAKVAFKQVSV